MVVPQGNDKKLDYGLAHIVQGKQNLAQPIIDDDGFTYLIGLVVVARTWLQTYMLRKNGIPIFKDYEKHKTILIYSHLLIEENVKLFKTSWRTKSN